MQPILIAKKNKNRFITYINYHTYLGQNHKIFNVIIM